MSYFGKPRIFGEPLGLLLMRGGAGADPLDTLDAGLAAIPNGGVLLHHWNPDRNVYADAAGTTPATDGNPVRAFKDSVDAAYMPAEAGDVSLCPTYRASVAAANNKAALEWFGAQQLLVAGLSVDWTQLESWCAIAVALTETQQASDNVLLASSGGVGSSRFSVGANDFNIRVSDGTLTRIARSQNANPSPHDEALHFIQYRHFATNSRQTVVDGIAGTEETTELGTWTNTSVSMGYTPSVLRYTGYSFAKAILNLEASTDKAADVNYVENLLRAYYGAAV